MRSSYLPIGCLAKWTFNTASSRKLDVDLRIITIMALLVMAVPNQADGQAPGPSMTDSPPIRFWIGGGLGVAQGGIPAFSSCGRLGTNVNGEFVPTVQGGVRLRPILQFEGALLAHLFTGDGCSRVALGPPTPAEELGRSVYPYTSVQGRIVVEPGSDEAILRPRVLVGVGWVWSENLPYSVLGLGISAGGLRARFVLDANAHQLTAPYPTRRFEAGQWIEFVDPGHERLIVVTATLQYFIGSRTP